MKSGEQAAAALPALTVILCTHNPRRDYLDRVLAALRAQTLPPTSWELLVMDNASSPPLASYGDVSWHPAARVLREERPGKIHAFARGVGEARGAALVMVDDDNVLQSDYLNEAVKVLAEWPRVGAFGGRISGEFEGPVFRWLKPYLVNLALTDFRPESTVKTASRKDAWDVLPPGAGLVVRTSLARAYLGKEDAGRAALGPGAGGRSLARNEDTDLVFDVLDQGYEMGYFPQLRLTHLIPGERLTCRYMARLRREGGESEAAVFFRHDVWQPDPRKARWRHIIGRGWRLWSEFNRRRWWIEFNKEVGYWKANRAAVRGKDVT